MLNVGRWHMYVTDATRAYVGFDAKVLAEPLQRAQEVCAQLTGHCRCSIEKLCTYQQIFFAQFEMTW